MKILSLSFSHLFQHVPTGRDADITVLGGKEKRSNDNSIVAVLLLYCLHKGPKCKYDVRGGVGSGHIVVAATNNNVHWFSDVHILLQEGGMHIVDLASDDAVKVNVEAGVVGGLSPDVVEGGRTDHHFPSSLLVSSMS